MDSLCLWTLLRAVGSHLPDPDIPREQSRCRFPGIIPGWREAGCVPCATGKAPEMPCEARGLPGSSPQHSFPITWPKAHRESKPAVQTAQEMGCAVASPTLGSDSITHSAAGLLRPHTLGNVLQTVTSHHSPQKQTHISETGSFVRSFCQDNSDTARQRPN